MALASVQKKQRIPAGKSVLDSADKPILLEHCRKMIRDGMLSQTWGILNIAAAVYNVHRFDLLPDYPSFEDAIEAEFGMSKRHANKYRLIGDRLGELMGGTAISQQMLEERLQTALYSTRLGFRKIHQLARTTDGIQRLLEAKSEGDLEEIISDFKNGAVAIQKEIDSQPKTDLKAAMRKQYSAKNPPEQTDITVLFAALNRQLEEINTKYLRKLVDALGSIPPKFLKDSIKYPKKAQQMWNALRAMEEQLAQIEELWPDQAGQAGALLKSLRLDIQHPVGEGSETAPVLGTRKGRMRHVQTPTATDVDSEDVTFDGPGMTEEESRAFVATLDGLPPKNQVTP